MYSSYLYFLMSIPLSVISPSVGSYSLQSSFTSVDFPQPFLPTRAIFSPIRHFRFMSLRVYSSLSGYLNQTCLNSNSYSLSSRFSVGIVPWYFSSGMSRKSKYCLQNVGVILSSPIPSEISETPADISSKYPTNAIISPGVNIPLIALNTAKPYISISVRIFTS